jgi:hypothetical protein
VIAVVAGGYVASLFMWRRLVLFFFVVFVLGVMGDVPSGFLASLVGITRHGDVIAVWLGWNV